MMFRGGRGIEGVEMTGGDFVGGGDDLGGKEGLDVLVISESDDVFGREEGETSGKLGTCDA